MMVIKKKTLQGFDIIADTHGSALELDSLLHLLGYEHNGTFWSHPERMVIFLGDYIDRGPFIRETLEMVRGMQESGNAVCLMGNHEMNAIAWATPDPQHDGEYLRPHIEKNLNQHRQTIEQLGDQYNEWIEWFKKLPLWGEFHLGDQTIHCIHACWSDLAMNTLREYRHEGKPILKGSENLPTMTEAGLELAGTKGTPVFEAIELLLKGAEIQLPEGYFMTDKDGHRRKNIRIQWWLEPKGTYREIAMVGEADRPSIPNIEIKADAFEPIPVPCPTFIGHYWLTADNGVEPMDENVVCLDYSAVREGPLVAYRFNIGDKGIRSENFVVLTNELEINDSFVRPTVKRYILESIDKHRDELDYLKDM